MEKKEKKKRKTGWGCAVPRSGSSVCTIVKVRKCPYLGPFAMNKKTLQSQNLKVVKERKCPYLGPFAMNRKTKDILLSQNLKVEEKKVALVIFYLWSKSHK